MSVSSLRKANLLPGHIRPTIKKCRARLLPERGLQLDGDPVRRDCRLFCNRAVRGTLRRATGTSDPAGGSGAAASTGMKTASPFSANRACFSLFADLPHGEDHRIPTTPAASSLCRRAATPLSPGEDRSPCPGPVLRSPGDARCPGYPVVRRCSPREEEKYPFVFSRENVVSALL